MEKRIVVCIMGQDCEETIEMCLNSVKDADFILYCDGGSKDKTFDIMKKIIKENKLEDKHICISNKFEKDKKGMNGIQRNIYLDELKKNYNGWFCLCLDSDEICDDLNQFREFINKFEDEKLNNLFSPRMRHLIGNLGNEDATQNIHYVLNRFFRISDDLYYPLEEHGFLKSTDVSKQQLILHDALIWHLGYINEVHDVMRRYNGQSNRISEGSHTQEFLDNWKNVHLFGLYPTKKVNPLDLPKVILDYYKIDKDELYHNRYQLELKHPIMVQQWKEYFKNYEVLDLGCGRGCYLYFWKWFLNDDAVKGIELSEWAVKNAFCKGIINGDISDENILKNIYHDYTGTPLIQWDLITAIDVLEHLDDKQLDKTLNNMAKYGKRFLFSIPFEGDPNLEADKTHKQFHTKDEWIKLIQSHGIIIKETPKEWLFANQILVGEKI
jgi:2-polyprenyl-3-methyl-5-hydroxy-6-metoxy-1,4-benzoquinol methylase